MRTLFLIAVTCFLCYSCNSSTESGQSDAPAEVPGKNKVTEEANPDMEADMTGHPGHAVYRQNCLPCHQADGNGVPGMHPSLQNTAWVNGDKERLIGIVLHGMTGEIKVNGEIYNSVMAPMPYLSDREIANVLTYVRKSFGNAADEITPDEVATVRNKK